MKNNEFRKIMNDNRNDIAKASRLGLGIVLGAVILIGVIFYGIAPKTRHKDESSSAAETGSAAEQVQIKNTPAAKELQEEEPAKDIPAGHLYRVFSDTSVYDRSGGYIGAAAEGEIYASYDELDISEFGTGKQIEIEYLSQTAYLMADDLVEVMPAVVLPTAADSILRDEYNGQQQCSVSDCGVIAAAALVNGQKLRSWDKVDLISADKLLETNGDLVSLINTYSGGDLIAEKISGDTESTLKSCIDEGKRVLLAVRYYDGVVDFDHSDYYGVTSNIQYVVVCGYRADEEEDLSFYCCDPFYGQYGRSLATVSSETLCASAELVDDERRGMIILH